jgi:hypothetical protein
MHAPKIHIIGRARQMEGEMKLPSVVVLDANVLAQHFGLTLHDAAKKLGVCLTSLKK